MSDPFKSHALGPAGPAIGGFAVTPSDSNDLTQMVRAISIGGEGGTLSFISSRDGQTYTTGELLPGTYPLFARRIRATGTTATGLTGWV
ncbi:spike base protein, RCAP_Rcc01079 family [Falsigemmobacter intermedius]|uniref:spike base protein, RCAP_Rcc01079 family n=1 Tax=Falsigemmobacter intermedius TaxID=1553448 RepID=UPI003F108B5A